MNSHSATTKLIAAIAGVTGITLLASPAHAAGLTGQIDIIWNADATPTSLEFYTFLNQADDGRGNIGDFLVSNATGSFSSLAPTPLTVTPGVIKDLPTIPVLGGSPISNWLDFANNTFDFTLTSFVNTSNLEYAFEGFFSDGTRGIGGLTTQINGSGVKSYSATITATAIPTPALLPGLIGLGLGILRKRNGEAEAVVDISAN
ncbi:MAG: PTPA-CTERM sorting domain-containing protein [Thainema sp.]